jgi:hypothetical protein
MSYPSFERSAEVVEQFINILTEHGIDLRHGSASENEALAMLDVLDMWRNPDRQPSDPRPVARAAMGFVDLAGKVVGVKDRADFGQLVPHLEMLGKTTVLQNASSPITDGDANKVIELYVACLAMTFGTNIALDHPINSKGDNPDVMLDFRGQRWALALKTLHSRKPRTIYDNIKKAADQIEASPATHGLVILNLKNLLDYDALWPSPLVSYRNHPIGTALRRAMECGLAQLTFFFQAATLFSAAAGIGFQFHGSSSARRGAMWSWIRARTSER